jgi:hypothetical protein
MKLATALDLIAAGLSESMAYHALAGTRNVSVPLALWLLDNDGLAVGPVVGKSKAELRMLRSLYAPAAPASVLRRRAALPANDSDTKAEAA